MPASPKELRKTPLNATHRECGAKMVAFGGWDMPVEYAGLISEHNAVRTAAGLFDVSHMGELELTGPGAESFLQRVTPNDVSRLGVGQGQYTSLPMENGAPVDDVVLFRRGSDSFLAIVNAANTAADLAWLREQSPEGCEILDVSERTALLALQGPRAEAVLSGLTELELSAIRFYHFAEGDVHGRPAFVSRTGYTGEDGFELMVSAEHAEPLWRRLLEAGADAGLVPVGLGARDTLRLEAKLCLYGQDLDRTTTLVEAGLGWTVCVDEAKGDFLGRGVLEEQKRNGAPRRLVGFEMVGRGIARHGYTVLLEGKPVGEVASGSYAPWIRRNIGLVYLPVQQSGVGQELEVEVRGRRIPARVVQTPFYKRPRQAG